VVRIHVGESSDTDPDMPADRATRRTTDTPVQRPPRTGIDISALAQRHALALRIAYLCCIAIATLLGLNADASLSNAADRLRRALEPALSFRDVTDAARNIALFVGWGATWVITSPAPTTRRTVAMATLLGMLASITVESAQVFSAVRYASIADVFTNTLGSLIGASAFWIFERRAITDLRSGTMIGVPGWMPAGALLLNAIGLAFAPSSRPTMHIAWESSPLGRAAKIASVTPVDVPWSALISDVAAWLVVGLGVSVAISDRTGRLRGLQLLAWLAIVGGMLPLVHLGRDMSGLQREAGTLGVQAVAVGIGLAAGLLAVPLWRRAVTARSTRALQLAALAAVLGAIIAWSPAAWAASGSTQVSWRQFVPMMSLFQRQDLSSVFLVLQKAGMGAAVGACLAARTRMGEPRPGVRAAVAYAALVEIGQVLVPGRYPDVTDILITTASAGLIAVLVERADRGARLSPGAASRP
jgi:VanZ family protein